jgi:formamidopyrimidine-DNA glycosylase
VPELPEVEVVRAGLQRYAAGRTIEKAEVLHPRAVRRHAAGPGDFAARLPGQLIMGARRRGKYLWLPMRRAGTGETAAAGANPGFRGAPAAPPPGAAGLRVVPDGPGVPSDPGLPGGRAAAGGPGVTGTVAGDALLAHLGMSGQLLVGDPGRPLSSHVRARFTFTDAGPDLRFVDQRTFGHLCLVPGGADLPAPIAHIAPDPLEAAFDPALFAAALRRRRTGLKRALLDQSLISGVGNIYADEALWRARLHWARPAQTLRKAEVERLLIAISEVLGEALQAGGTSFDALYVNVNGESGYFGRSLAVYGRAGQPCPRCGQPVRRDAFMNRSAYTCPRCQPRPRHARW